MTPSLITFDPEIRDGEAIVAGTRIPVSMLQDLARAGVTREELLADYDITEAQLEAALAMDLMARLQRSLKR